MSSSSDRSKKSANDVLFKTLLMDPGKRAKVLELLMQEGLVEDNENASPNNFLPKKLYSPLAKLQRSDSGSKKGKVRLESPSALARRRALEKIKSQNSSTDDAQKKIKSPPLVGTPLPFDQLLRGVVAYCEVRSNGQDRSAGIKTMMRAMGAKVCEHLNTGVTHIIFKDGLYSTFRKAQCLKVHLVSVLWLDAVRRHKFRVPEVKYRALGVDAYNQDSEARICQEMQKEFDDVIQDEYRRISHVQEIRTHEFNNTNNFVTQRRKPTANVPGLASIHDISSPSQDINVDDEPMDNPYIGAPICTTPALSESTFCSSSEGAVKMPEKGDMNIVPCSQSASQSFTHDKEKQQHLQRVEEVKNTTEVEESVDNIAKYVRDSFELEKAKQIKSPPQDTKRASNVSALSGYSENVLTEDDSVNLQLTISDESNRHSSVNKSKSFSNNAQSFLEAENVANEKTVDETEDDLSEEVNNYYFMEKDNNSIFPTVKPIKTYSGKRSSILSPQRFAKPDEKTSSVESINNLDLIQKDDSVAKKHRERSTTLVPPQKSTFDDTDEENESVIKKTRRTSAVPQLTSGKTSEENNLELIKKDVDKIITAAKNPRRKRATMFVPQQLMFDKTNEENDIEQSADIPTKNRRRRAMSIPAEPTEKEADKNVVATNKPRGRKTTISVRQKNEEIDKEHGYKGGNVSATKKNREKRTTRFVPQKLIFERTSDENDSEDSADIPVNKPRGKRITMPVRKTNKEINKEESAGKDRDYFPIKKIRERRTMFVPQKWMFEKTNEDSDSEEMEDISVKKSRGRRAMSVPSEQINAEIDIEHTEKEASENVPTINKSRARTVKFDPQEGIIEETNEDIDNEKSADINNSTAKKGDMLARQAVIAEKTNNEESVTNDSAVKKIRGRRTTMLVPQSIEKTMETIEEEKSAEESRIIKNIRSRRTTLLSPQKRIFDELDEEIHETESLPKEDSSSVVQKPKAAEERNKPRARKLFNVDQQFVDESLFNWDKMPKKNTPPKKVQFYAMLPDGFPKTLSYKARTKLIQTEKKRSNTIAKISTENPKSIPVRRSAQRLNFDGDDVDKPEEESTSVGKNNKQMEMNFGMDGIVAIASTSKIQPTVVRKKGTKPLRRSTRLTSFESITSDSDNVTKSDLELAQNVSKPIRKSIRSTKTINYANMYYDSQGSIESTTNKTDKSSQSNNEQRKPKALKMLENSDNGSDHSEQTFVSIDNDVIHSLPSTNSVIDKRKSKVRKITQSTAEDRGVAQEKHNKSDDTFVTCNSDEDAINKKTTKRKSDEMEAKIKETSNKKLITSNSDTEDDASPKRVTNKEVIKDRLKSASTGSELSAYESTSTDSTTPTSKRTTKNVELKSPRRRRNCASVFKRPPTTPNNQKIIPQSPQTEPLRKTVPQTPQTEPSRRINRQTPSSVFKKPRKTPKKQVNQLKAPESEATSNRRSTLEFVQRPDKKEQLRLTQKAKSVVKTLGGIVCTKFKEEDVQLFQQIVHKFGGFIIEPTVTKRTTHLVAEAPLRTINLLRAIARGCWILRKEWLYKSLEEGKWLEEEDYEMTEFSIAVQKCRLEKQSFGPSYSVDIFKDCGSIFVSRTSSPRYTDIEELIQLCGGHVVRIVRDAEIFVGEQSRNNEKNTVSVTEKWVLDSITNNKKRGFKHYQL